MATQLVDKKELVAAINEVRDQLVGLMSALDEKVINSVPYADSWTAGQLFRHVAKSTMGITQAMRMEAQPAQRDAGERIPDLKRTFLDFIHKLKAPDSIIPEKGPYQKQAIMEELSKSFDELNEATTDANLSDLVTNPALGEITKLEMLHFVWYHTQRHLHQFRKICAALQTT